MVTVHKQLSVFLANVPGTLAEVLKILASENINIVGLMVTDSIDHAVIRLVVNDPTKAAHLLGHQGVLVIESEVLAVTLKDEPGALLKVASRLSEANINIAYTYATDGTSGDVVAIIRPTNMEAAKEALAPLYPSQA